MQLSKNLKTYVLDFKDHSRPRKYLTDAQMQVLRKALSDRNTRYLDLTDDDGNYLETVEKIEVKGIRKLEEDPQGGNRKYICGFGTRHNPAEECRCRTRFGMDEYRFHKIMAIKHNVRYPDQITPEMQNNFSK